MSKDPRLTSLELVVERVILASRWLQAPLYMVSAILLAWLDKIAFGSASKAAKDKKEIP